MPITATHPDHDKFAPQWQRLRHAFDGRDSIKAIPYRQTYLPRLEGQNGEFEKDYEGYVTRALWTGYSDRTLDGLVGAVFRKDPMIEFPEQWASWIDDVTLTGRPLLDFARTVFREAIGINWGGVLVDQPSAENTPREERRPALRLYEAEDIRNWRIELVRGIPTVTQIILHEMFDEPAEDGFGMETDEQFRELILTSVDTILPDGRTDGTLRYLQQLYRKQRTEDGTEQWLPFGDPIMPVRMEQPLSMIPFFPISADGMEFQIQTSHLLDLVDINYDHYRLDADHKHGLHFTALPTAWIAGFPTEATYRIGSQAAWVTTDSGARAGFLEFTGTGLGAIATEKEADERRMAVLGARLLEEQKRAAESAETVRLRQGGEESVIKTAARAVSQSLTEALWFMAWWGGAEDPEASIGLNTDVVAAGISPQLLTALWQVYLGDGISQQTFLEALVRGEVVQGRTWEEEQALIAANMIPDRPLPEP